MARVQYGSQITALSGSIGGLTFHKNKANNIARLRPSIPFVSTPKQFLKQSIFNYLVNLYSELALGTKELWNDFAAAHTKVNFWGEEKTLSGYNWFLSINYWKYHLTGQTFTTPPTYQSPIAVPPFEVALGDTTITLIPDPSWPIDCYKICFGTFLLRTTSLSNRKALRHITENPGTTGSWDVTDEWNSIYNATYPPPFLLTPFSMIFAVITVTSPSFIPSAAFLAISEYTP